MANSAPEQEITVFATVVYWQAREVPLLERCVDSLLRQACGDAVHLKIILVDNASGAAPRLADDRRIEQIRLPENRGFAGGHNVAIRRALERGADYVLLLNSDAVAEQGLIQKLTMYARSHATVAFVGPLIVRASDPGRVESAGQSFDARTGRHTEIHRGHMINAVDPSPRSVDAVSGCALLARRSAIEAIGLLDEDLFAYFEDMDWCLRARHAGYEVAVVPDARVLHLGKGSTGGSSSPLSTYYSVRNHMVVAARYGTPITRPLVLAYHLAFLARSGDRRTGQHVMALARGASAAWSGHLGRLETSAHRD